MEFVAKVTLEPIALPSDAPETTTPEIKELLFTMIGMMVKENPSIQTELLNLLQKGD